ncbi:hypothetical protein V2I01_19810 [Micromonospora sp. BRA006-A]|nr:hypothetical protein [Micromonospora sp. BRA006-A]
MDEALGRAPRQGARSPPGSSAPTTSRSATTSCARTPPRSTRTASGSRCRWNCRSAPGRRRTSNSARSLVDSPLPESDLFAGVREACRAH